MRKSNDLEAHHYCKKLGNKKEINKNNKNDNRKERKKEGQWINWTG